MYARTSLTVYFAGFHYSIMLSAADYSAKSPERFHRNVSEVETGVDTGIETGPVWRGPCCVLYCMLYIMLVVCATLS